MSDKKEEGGEIAQAIVQIDRALNEAGHHLSKLRERMQPVLSPAACLISAGTVSLGSLVINGATDAAAWSAPANPKTKSPLREQLDDVTARSKELNNTLKYLLNALAL